MTDLARVLPNFPTAPFSTQLAAVEQHALTTSDLLALHPADVARQTKVALLDLKRFVAAVRAALCDDVLPEKLLLLPTQTGGLTEGGGDAGAGAGADADAGTDAGTEAEDQKPKPATKASIPPPQDQRISTLDDHLDAALGGGVPTGRLTEVAGESGAGKTQLLLALCLAVQLPYPRGTGRQAVYISTESGPATPRLKQMLAANPILRQHNNNTNNINSGKSGNSGNSNSSSKVSLDNILMTLTPDLESQEHILEFQLPVLLARHRIGLVVLDSVAANYRAEFDRRAASASHGSNMAARGADLVRLGALLRDVARRHGVAVVVANQVADRFALPPVLPSFSPVPVPPPPSSSSLSLSSSCRRGLLPSSSAAATATAAATESPEASRGVRSVVRGSTPASPIPSSATAAATVTAFIPSEEGAPPPPPPPPSLRLDHQQRWFTGWGDDPHAPDPLKTPSLGLVWSTQIACRIVLLKRPVYGRTRRLAAPLDASTTTTTTSNRPNQRNDDKDVENENANTGQRLTVAAPTLKSWRRWLKVVFAPHVAASGQGLHGATEFDVTAGGLCAVVKPAAKDHF